VNAITLDDIKQVAAKYFRDQPYVLATVQPASAEGTAGRPNQGTAVSSPPPKTPPDNSPAAKQK
jgi:hypothetical protein